MVNITMEIPIKKRGSNIVVRDTKVLQMVMGTSSVVGNLSFYGVKKVKGGFEIPESVLRLRVEEMKLKIVDWQQRVALMEQVLRR